MVVMAQRKQEQPLLRAYDDLQFTLNGESFYLASKDLDPEMTLLDFIRLKTKLKGTKKGCGEGG